jgi:hypothetical protein
MYNYPFDVDAELSPNDKVYLDCKLWSIFGGFVAQEGTILPTSFWRVDYLDNTPAAVNGSFLAEKTSPQTFTVGAPFDTIMFENDTVAPAFDPADTYHPAPSKHFVPETSLQSLLPDNIRCVDFFMSLVKMFNLYLDRDKDNTTNIIIEPRDIYYVSGSTVDWSEKLDYSKDIHLIPMGELDFKTLTYRYSEDSDFWNGKYKKDFGEVYGQRTVKVDNDFVKTDTVNEVIFAPTPSVEAIGNEYIVVPTVIKDDPAGDLTPNFFDNAKPRILIYGGRKSSGVDGFMLHDAPTETLTGTTNNPTYFPGSITYPYAGMWDDPYSPNYSIMFGTPKEVYHTPITIQNINDLYSMFHHTYVSEIADKDSKIIVANLYLDVNDIFNLDFRNRIFFDGHHLRLNKIIEYDMVTEKVTKCEFIKVKKQQPFNPGGFITPPSPKTYNIIEGGNNEVRNIAATSYYNVIEGGFNEVRNLGASSTITIIKG